MDQNKQHIGGSPGRQKRLNQDVSGRVRPRSYQYTPDRKVFSKEPDTTVVSDNTSPNLGQTFDIQSTKSPVPRSHRTPSKTKPARARTTRSFVLRRQIQEGAKRHKQKVRRVHRLHFIGYIATAVVLLAFGVVLWSFQGVLPFRLDFLQSTAPSSMINKSEPTDSTSSLDESEVTDTMLSNHLVDSVAPRIVRIPSLDVEARIKRVGVSLNAEPIAPTNIYDVGWFESAGTPGSDNLSLLNGHTVGPTKSGVFNNLHTIQEGAIIEVERGDGTKITYVVKRISSYSSSEIDINTAFRPFNESQATLNIITTPIRYNLSSSPEKRVVVSAVEVKNEN